MLQHCLSRISLGMIAFLWSVAPAQSQYYPPPPGYYPPPGYGGFGPGNVLNGQANLLQAQGQATINVEQARVEREKALQAKQDTKKKTFDEMMYEKANTPTYTQEMTKIDTMILQRILTKASDTEIITGKAENIMLPYLRTLAAQGIQGPPVRLDQNLLKEVNVTAGTKNSLGPLKDGGHLEWPLALQSKEQAKLATMIPTAVSQVSMGKLDPKLYREITKGLTKVREEMRTKYRTEEIDTSDFLEGQRFLDPVEQAIQGLRQAGANKFLDGTYAARGDTVAELVQNMSNNGLQFGPATPGQENAYFALYNGMVSYTYGAQNRSGFQVRLAPTGFSGDPYAAFKKQ